MIGYFIIGMTTGIAYSIGFSIVEGLFGKSALQALFVGFVAIFAVGYMFMGVDSMAADISPWPYWVGLFMGVVLSFPAAVEIEERLTRNGTPLVVEVIR